MTFRSLMLAGTVLPFAICCPALALADGPSAPAAFILAQADVPCPEGQECPPLEGAPGDAGVAPTEPDPNAAPPEEPPPPPQDAAPEQLPPVEEPPPPVEEPPPPVEEPPLPAEEPPPPAEEPPTMEEPPAQPEQIEPQPEPEPQPEIEAPPADAPPPTMDAAPPEEVPPQDQIEPQPEGPPEQGPPPSDTGAELPPEQLPPDGPPVEVIPPAAGGETTVDQQLEAQGDQEEANRVRGLRDRLLDQLQEVIVPGETQTGRPSRGLEGWYEGDDVVEQQGNSIIIDLGGGQIYVQPIVPDDADRLLYGAEDVEVQQLRGGRTRTIVTRQNGVQIITVRDRYGDIISRIKRLPDGTDIVLIDNRFDDDGDGPRPTWILRDVRRPRVDIPEDEYIVDLGEADYDEIRGALLAPPVQQLERPYTLDEVLRNEPIRAYSPRVDLDTITFEFGSATIGNDQMQSLVYLGQAMEDVLAEHPDEVYLIEGHTDAVGSNYDNLVLSDRRAEAVAVALSQNFDIAPENLITQGYGEQYLKIDTDGPERRNRRAAVRRVTELLQAQSQ
jgi:outer membrane protein OmpA-like peptidoglycan-associated protein